MKYLHVNSQKNLKKFNNLCKKENMLVYYYGTYCGWCKKLDPTWEELIKTVPQKNGILVKLNKDFIDGTECRHTVYTVPTILYLNKGKLGDLYRGDRSLPSLLKFINKNFVKKKTPKIYIPRMPINWRDVMSTPLRPIKNVFRKGKTIRGRRKRYFLNNIKTQKKRKRRPRTRRKHRSRNKGLKRRRKRKHRSRNKGLKRRRKRK